MSRNGYYIECEDCKRDIDIEYKGTLPSTVYCSACGETTVVDPNSGNGLKVKTTHVSRYEIWNRVRYYSTAKIVLAIVFLLAGIIIVVCSIPFPWDLFATILIAFAAWQIGSGVVVVDYNNINALNKIIINGYKNRKTERRSPRPGALF